MKEVLCVEIHTWWDLMALNIEFNYDSQVLIVVINEVFYEWCERFAWEISIGGVNGANIMR